MVGHKIFLIIADIVSQGRKKNSNCRREFLIMKFMKLNFPAQNIINLNF